MSIKLYNTLTKTKQELKPTKKGKIGIYSCGPTVYWNQHIGHMYAYIQWDVLVRFLKYQGYDVAWVMNITDVGHLESDEDTGEDKMQKGAKREGITVWQVAEKYTNQFKDSLKLLNVNIPDTMPKATEHVEEQIKLAQEIEKNGFTYETKKGLVFDTTKFSDYTKFANLNLDKQKKRDDVTSDPDKKNPWDFFLWVKDEKHVMHWDSPWGVGYPGWHIECTAMSTKYLGNKFDIHTGGLEHIPVHHTNEIAQGFGAFGEHTANYWLHNAWLKSEGGEKMSKSLGNFVTVQELVEKGYDPLAFRYLVLQSHYRKGMNFSFKALDAAQKALKKLRKIASGLEKSGSSKIAGNSYLVKFIEALSDDLNIPKALAIVWETVKSNQPDETKRALLEEFDKVLGLDIFKKETKKNTPEKVTALLKKRDELRAAGKYEEADKIRAQIEKKGYTVKDTELGSRVE
jgi:cysteinyl-tRNA synthetase